MSVAHSAVALVEMFSLNIFNLLSNFSYKASGEVLNECYILIGIRYTQEATKRKFLFDLFQRRLS